MRGPLPFVVYTSPRSGSAWLVSLLHSHPAVVCYSELFLAGERGFPSYAGCDLPYFQEHLGGRRRSLLRTARYLRRVYRARPGVEAAGFKLMYAQASHHPAPSRAAAGSSGAPGAPQPASRHRLLLLRGWYPFEVLHFPLRSRGQASRTLAGRAASIRLGLGYLPRHVDEDARAQAAGRRRALDRWLVAGEGVVEGGVVLDTRLRDALGGLAGVEELPSRPTFPSPGELPRLRIPLPSLAQEAAFADDLAALARFDSQVRLEERIRALERRLAAAERGLLAPVIGRLRRGP